MGVAVVTGGGRRVGRAICLALGAAGFDVVVHANRSVADAHDVVRELEALGAAGWVVRADLSIASEVATLAEEIQVEHPALALLVNSAAEYEQRPFEDITHEQLRRMLAVNLEAPFLLTQQLLPALRAGDGCVVNITDVAVTHPYTSTHTFAHYIASKAALDQLTRAWALELAPDIRVNAVAPGPVAVSADTTAAQRTELFSRLPLGREGSPGDVADAVVYLANATFVTGQTIRVDGGLSLT